MPAEMTPLRDEHQELIPHIEALRDAGEAVGSSTNDVLALVDEAYEFLTHHLIPHAMAEDEALYPVVQRVMGAPEATATMSRDHKEVDRLTASLNELRARVRAGETGDAIERELRRVLYGLYAVVKLHFAKEEEVYVPLLEAQLNESEATAMFQAMHEAAARAARATPS
jgi:iron-sulfur cluster repair protein YtfE (RIC family)